MTNKKSRNGTSPNWLSRAALTCCHYDSQKEWTEFSHQLCSWAGSQELVSSLHTGADLDLESSSFSSRRSGLLPYCWETPRCICRNSRNKTDTFTSFCRQEEYLRDKNRTSNWTSNRTSNWTGSCRALPVSNKLSVLLQSSLGFLLRGKLYVRLSRVSPPGVGNHGDPVLSYIETCVNKTKKLMSKSCCAQSIKTHFGRIDM